ncbi:hypothetical protein [Enterococcus pallens]|uniref:Alternate signal-mediated exported protein n=1 Tax=Enterococcus pallens ATCC BAA-351 TaxID=1158607 RepID=R2SJJ3_9ENTE|nr:hypothetical protein [Enterococcus pallens]EOH95385.1 alternate signal-mediated exported protein [Enterococcus pallens ATCC BAA-351]EOU21478.1 hypothetical protein I588_02325 [Enterococcus pallens ATCC BAA-351]
MKKNSKKKKLMAAAAGLALIAAISGTFAWITSQDQRVNKVSSSAVVDNSVTINEEWEPKPLVAGTEATKKVSISNTGTASVFVRVSYEEVLKHLTNKGEIKFAPTTGAGAVPSAKYTYVANDPGLGKHMPAETLVTGYVEATNVTGLEPNTKLFVKGGRIVDGVTGAISYNDEPKVVHEYAPGKYQDMTATVTIPNKDTEASNDAKDWTFTVSDSQYGYFENGYKHTVANWAKSSLEDEAGNLTGNALLGTSGNRHGVSYKYTIADLGIAAIPGESVTTNTAQIPTGAGQKAVQADTDPTGLGKSEINVNYTAAVIGQAALATATDNWIYNSEDGWFYYTQPLKNGVTTAELLDKLVFGSAMGTEYRNASYDLVVKMEAIQATPEALTDSSGWKLDITPATKPITKAIYDKLTQ